MNTLQSRGIEFGGVTLLSGFLEENSITKFTFTHSHPNGYSLTPSGLDGNSNPHGGNDIKMKTNFDKLYPGRVTNYIYSKGNTAKF